MSKFNIQSAMATYFEAETKHLTNANTALSSIVVHLYNENMKAYDALCVFHVETKDKRTKLVAMKTNKANLKKFEEKRKAESEQLPINFYAREMGRRAVSVATGAYIGDVTQWRTSMIQGVYAEYTTLSAKFEELKGKSDSKEQRRIVGQQIGAINSAFNRIIKAVSTLVFYECRNVRLMKSNNGMIELQQHISPEAMDVLKGADKDNIDLHYTDNVQKYVSSLVAEAPAGESDAKEIGNRKLKDVSLFELCNRVMENTSINNAPRLIETLFDKVIDGNKETVKAKTIIGLYNLSQHLKVITNQEGFMDAVDTINEAIENDNDTDLVVNEQVREAVTG